MKWHPPFRRAAEHYVFSKGRHSFVTFFANLTCEQKYREMMTIYITAKLWINDNRGTDAIGFLKPDSRTSKAVSVQQVASISPDCWFCNTYSICGCVSQPRVLAPANSPAPFFNPTHPIKTSQTLSSPHLSSQSLVDMCPWLQRVTSTDQNLKWLHWCFEHVSPQ